MLAALSTLTFDPAGHVLLDVLPASAFQPRSRRNERVATLDGGSVFNDFGYSDSDTTIRLVWKVTDRATEQAVDRLARFYSRLHLSLDGAAYIVAVDNYSPGQDESEMTLMVVRLATN